MRKFVYNSTLDVPVPDNFKKEMVLRTHHFKDGELLSNILALNISSDAKINVYTGEDGYATLTWYSLETDEEYSQREYDYRYAEYRKHRPLTERQLRLKEAAEEREIKKKLKEYNKLKKELKNYI
jgi:hypothetical protein